MRFGKYFNSQDGGSDKLFKQRTLLDVRSFAAFNSGRLPDHVIVESWFPVPSRLLPSPTTRRLGDGDSFMDTAAAVRQWTDKRQVPDTYECTITSCAFT